MASSDDRTIELIEKYQILQGEVYIDPNLIREIAIRYQDKFIEFVKAAEQAIENTFNVKWLIKLIHPETRLSGISLLKEVVDDISSERVDISDLRRKDRVIINEFIQVTWPAFLKEIEDIGYDFNYFNFFLKIHPLVRVRQENIALTPQNFEVGADFVDLQQYEEALEAIRTAAPKIGKRWPADNTSRYPVSVVGPFWRPYQPLPIVKYTLKYPVNSYPGNPYHQDIGPVGWKKDDIRNAIRATGLNDPIERTTSDGKTVKHYQLSEMFGRDPTKKMWGLGLWSYLTKFYYETLYRKVFNTLINIDWVEVCRQNLARIEDLKRAAIVDFGLNREQIEPLEYDQVCDLLDQESKRRRTIREELTVGIPEAQAAVTLQPGGRLMQQAQTEAAARQPEMFAPVAEPEKEVKPELRRLIDMCADPEVTREQIFALAQEMDLEILFARLPQAAPTKEDYCRVLKNYLERSST